MIVHSHNHLAITFLLQAIVDGLVGRGNEKQGVYVSFDLSVSTHSGIEQRDVRVGVHFLYYNGRILGAADRDFLSCAFDPNHEWKQVSTHSSCWADSFDCYVNDIVRDIIKNGKKSQYVKPHYSQDKLSFNEESYSTNMIARTVRLVEMVDLVKIKYVNWDNEKIYKIDLVWQDK